MKRDTIAFGVHNLTGMAMSWTNFAINLTYLDTMHYYPDSCMIVLRASGAMPTNNDYLWVDNLAFFGSVDPINPVSIDEKKNFDRAFNIFPNPAINKLNINSNGGTLEMFDLNGKIVRTINTSSSAVSIDTADLPRGVYFVVLTTNEEVVRRKVVLQ